MAANSGTTLEGSAKPPAKKPAAKPKAAPKPAAAPTTANFAADVLKGLGMPVSAQNKAFIQAWANREGGGGSFNPLNTTQPAAGAGNLAGNSAGVKNYTSYAQGVQATVQTLSNGAYADILGALKTGKASTSQTLSGLGTWSGNGYTSLTGVNATAHAVSSTGAAGTDGVGNTATSTDGATSVAATSYGYLAGFLKDPELGPIIKEAAAQGWDTDTLMGALSKTQYWKRTSDSARQFDAQAQTDPATHQQAIANQAASIQLIATKDGVQIPSAKVQKIASDSLRFGWSADQVNSAVASEFTYQQGSSNATVQSLKQIAASYVIPVSDQALTSWTQNIISGKQTSADFTAYAITQAKSAHPSLAASIDAGNTTQTLLDPYGQIAGQTLGIDPNTINFLDPKWSPAINQIDQKTGQSVPMSLAQWTQTLKTNPIYGYNQSAQGQSDAQSFGQSFRSLMGL